MLNVQAIYMYLFCFRCQTLYVSNPIDFFKVCKQYDSFYLAIALSHSVEICEKLRLLNSDFLKLPDKFSNRKFWTDSSMNTEFCQNWSHILFYKLSVRKSIKFPLCTLRMAFSRYLFYGGLCLLRSEA